MADEKTIGQRKIEALQRKNQAEEIAAIKGLPTLLNKVNKKFAEDLMGSFIKETKSGNLTLDKAAIQADPAAAQKAIKEFQAEGTIKADIDNLSDSVKNGFKKLGDDSKQLQKRDAEGNKKFLQKLFGTPGDRKQAQAELLNTFKEMPGKITNKLGTVLKGAFASLKDGVGTFFDIIKTGLLLIGGLAALEAFVMGWDKAEDWLSKNPNFGDRLAAGLTGIVQAFTGMTDTEAKELAIKLADKFQIVTNIIKRIGEAFGNILGLNTEEESRSLFDKIKDWSIAIGTTLLLFTNIASTMAVAVIKGAFSLLYQAGLLLLNTKFLSARFLKVNFYLGGKKIKAALTALRLGAIAFATVTIPAMAATIWTMVTAVGAFLVSNPIGWIILALLAVGAALYIFWDDIKAMNQAISDAGGIFIFMKYAWAKVTDGFGRFVNGIIDFYNYMVDKVNKVLPARFELSKIGSSSRFATNSAAKIRDEMLANKLAAEEKRSIDAAAMEVQDNTPGGNVPSESEQLAAFENEMAQLNAGLGGGGGDFNLAMPVVNNNNQTNNLTQTVLKTRPGYTLDFNGAYGY